MKERFVWDFNRHNINSGDIFYLDYYGINVFFCVGYHTKADGVCVYELRLKNKKVKGVCYDSVCRTRVGSRFPLFVPKEENSYYKTRYIVETGKEKRTPYIVLEIGYDSKIYQYARSLGIKSPKTGKIYLKKFNYDIDRYYFNKAQQKEEETNWA